MITILNTPSNEIKRIKALKRYNILDTPPNGSFDHLTKLASVLFNMPISIISLVDEDRIWFKSHHGVNVKEIGRAPGLCASAIMSNDLYIVENAIEDPRTITNPLVAGEFGLRFYAAAPLITKDGYNLGTFCIIDKKQRYLNTEQREILAKLADIVMDEIELRLSARNLLSNVGKHLKSTLKEIEGELSLGGNQKLKSLNETSRKLIANINRQLELNS